MCPLKALCRNMCTAPLTAGLFGDFVLTLQLSQKLEHISHRCKVAYIN